MPTADRPDGESLAAPVVLSPTRGARPSTPIGRHQRVAELYWRKMVAHLWEDSSSPTVAQIELAERIEFPLPPDTPRRVAEVLLRRHLKGPQGRTFGAPHLVAGAGLPSEREEPGTAERMEMNREAPGLPGPRRCPAAALVASFGRGPYAFRDCQ